MTTKVISIRQAPAGWEHNPDFVYIGRAGRGHDGYFGNPHSIGDCQCGQQHDRAGAIRAFNEDFQRYLRNPEYVFALRGCKGKTLVCFCAPQACHGDVIAQWLDKNA